MLDMQLAGSLFLTSRLLPIFTARCRIKPSRSTFCTGEAHFPCMSQVAMCRNTNSESTCSKTTSAVIDGSGQNQTVEMPMEAAGVSILYFSLISEYNFGSTFRSEFLLFAGCWWNAADTGNSWYYGARRLACTWPDWRRKENDTAPWFIKSRSCFGTWRCVEQSSRPFAHEKGMLVASNT